MRLNITKRIKVKLEPQECIKILEEAANSDFTKDFHFFPLTSEYRFYPISKDKNRFSLRPVSGWDRFTLVFGNIKEEDQSTILYLRMYPPIWFYFLFCIVPVFLLTMSGGFRETFPFSLIWIGFMIFVIIGNICIARKLFSIIEKIIRGNV